MLKTEDMVFTGTKLVDTDLPRLGHLIGVGEDIIHALIETETAGSFTDKAGRLPMLYEPHVAFKEAPTDAIRTKLVKAGLAYAKWGTKPYPSDSYPRFWKAYEIHPETALKACSWGGTQVMGFNYALAGYKTPEAMVQAMLESQANQLMAMIRFVENSNLDDELQAIQAKLNKGQKVTADDCRAFVRGYNGAGYEKNGYHTKFAKNLNKWVKIPDTPWSPDDPGTVDLYDGKVHDELKAIQSSLDEIGYPEVGMIDGRWGTRSAAAVMAFRLDNGLQTTDPRIDNEFLRTLALKPQRPISPVRKNATLSDLRHEGDIAVKEVDQTNTIGKITVGLGAGGAVLKGVEQLQQYSDAFTKLNDAISPIYDIVSANWYIIPIMVGIGVIWKSGILNKIRLQKHQTGTDVSA